MTFADPLPEVGVGITYDPSIEELVRIPGLLDFVEIEPQTMWQETGDPAEPYRMLEAVLEHLAGLPVKKLVHSVGVPVGGTVLPDARQFGLLRETLVRLRSPWFSDHLSFNKTGEFATGFFLPPRQTGAGVASAVASIRMLQDAFPVPVAVETGVNYLRRQPDEMSDGRFVREVAEAADCRILLDLHNVFSNALNGRQPMDEFVAELPLERICEVHLAGGFEMEGYWVDAHSGDVPEELFVAAEAIVRSLPNLRAINFEIFPSYVPLVGLDRIRDQLLRIRELWNRRGSSPYSSCRSCETAAARSPNAASPEAWERALGTLVIGRPPDDMLTERLAGDPAIRLINRMAVEFRGSMVVNVYRLTSRLLMLALGVDNFRVLLEHFWRQRPPELYAAAEAAAFIDYLEALNLAVPQLGIVVRYERAVAATVADGQTRIVTFRQDPFPMLLALADGRLPTVDSQFGEFEIEVTAEGQLDAYRPAVSAH